jgi:hypothetical protein
MTLRQMLNRLFKCRKEHNFTSSASCPFTLQTYWYCGNCNYRKAVPTNVSV